MPRHFRSQRMVKQWTSTGSGNVAFTASGTGLLSSLLFAEPGTVLRLRDNILITPTANPVAGDDCVIAVGIGIVSSDAVGVGASAMPDPANEPDYPWLWWGSWRFFAETATLGDMAEAALTVRVDVDSKAMRKIKPGQALATVAEYIDQVGTPPYQVASGIGRVLIGT